MIMGKVKKVKCYRASGVDPRALVVSYDVFRKEQERCLRAFGQELWWLQNQGYISAERRKDVMARVMCNLCVEEVW